MLALLPLDPGTCVLAGREERVDGGPKLRVAPQTARERELGELEPEPAPQVAEAPQAVQLGRARRAGSPPSCGAARRGRSPRGSGASAPTSRVSRAAAPTVSGSCTPTTLPDTCEGWRLGGRGAGAAVRVLEPHDVVELRRRDLEDRRVLERGHAVHRAGPVVEGGARRRSPLPSASSPPPRRARASRGRTGRATTRPSRGGTGARASGPPSRTAPCRSRRR